MVFDTILIYCISISRLLVTVNLSFSSCGFILNRYHIIFFLFSSFYRSPTLKQTEKADAGDQIQPVFISQFPQAVRNAQANLLQNNLTAGHGSYFLNFIYASKIIMLYPPLGTSTVSVYA